MRESLFIKLFSYRERESSSPLENFLTEALAFCIAVDSAFKNALFKKLKIPNEGLHNITTQESYGVNGRPDIEMSNEKICVLFECKVEAGEGHNQLENYCKILANKINIKGKYLVYLTKYFEKKFINNRDIKLIQLRWSQIHEIIHSDNKDITLQLKSFLKELGMDKTKNFSLQDMLAMKTITETMTKMDELLEQFKDDFYEHFGGYSKDSSRSTNLYYNNYINYVTLKFEGIEYYLQIGFYWWSDEAQFPFVGLNILFASKKFKASNIYTMLSESLNTGWVFSDDGTWASFANLKPMTFFVSEEIDNIPKMTTFLNVELEQLYKIREVNPTLFTK